MQKTRQPLFRLVPGTNCTNSELHVEVGAVSETRYYAQYKLLVLYFTSTTSMFKERMYDSKSLPHHARHTFCEPIDDILSKSLCLYEGWVTLAEDYLPAVMLRVKVQK
jgi:hypothetical protein